MSSKFFESEMYGYLDLAQNNVKLQACGRIDLFNNGKCKDKKRKNMELTKTQTKMKEYAMVLLDFFL